MSEDSSSDESRETSSPKRPSRKRRRLQPVADDVPIKEDEQGFGVLTEVSADYRHKLREAEVSTFVKKSKLDIDAEKPDVARKRSRTRLSISSSSSDEEEEGDENSTAAKNDDAGYLPHFPRQPSPPRFATTPKALSSKRVGEKVLSELAEIQKVRRDLAADRLKCRRDSRLDEGTGGGGGGVLALDDEDAYSSCDGLVVKVLSLKSGVLRRVKMSPKDTFALVYSLMASTEGVPVEALRLTLRDSTMVVMPGDTYEDHGLTICDIVECVVMRENSTISTAKETDAVSVLNVGEKNPNEISLNIQSTDSKTGRFTTHKISKRAALKALMEQFADSQGMTLDCFKFSFDGEKIDPNSTPEELDMEDEDCIDVVVTTRALAKS